MIDSNRSPAEISHPQSKSEVPPSWLVNAGALINNSFFKFPSFEIFVAIVLWLLSRVQLSATLWTIAHKALLFFTICQSALKLMSIESVMLCNYLTLCSPTPHFSFAFSLSQHQGLFQWVGTLPQVAKVLALQLKHQSFQWIYRVDFL